jgi:hypothetical protein
MSDHNEESQIPQDESLFTNEIEETVQEEVVSEQDVETTNEAPADPLVEKAKSTGHLSLDEWVAQGKDPKLYKTEKEYALTGELIDLKRKLDKRDDEIAAIIKYNQDRIEEHKQRARYEISQQLAQAEQMGDISAIKNLTLEQAAMEARMVQESYERQAQIVKQIDGDFTERNKHWFNDQHPELIDEAKRLGMEMQERYPELSYIERVRRIEDEMRYLYPDVVRKPTTRPSPTISMSRSSVNQSSTESIPSENKLYKTLDQGDRAYLDSLNRMAKKMGYAPKTVKEFLEQKRKDGEI